MPQDGGTPAIDASSSDAGVVDAGPVDASSPDASFPDGSPPDDPGTRPDFSPVNIDQTGRRFLDEQGRTLFLRGVNARVEGVFDVVFDDGRERLEPLPDLPVGDCTRMRELGLNLIRLPISWSALEATQGVFDDTYLDRIDAVVQCARDAGLYVLVDFHFDAYSKHIGGNGAPYWAIIPEPEPGELVEGPMSESDLADWRTSVVVLFAYESFFSATDELGLQAEFLDAVGYVASHYADSDTVIGVEIFDAPFGDPRIVHPFNKAAAARIAEEAPTKLAVFDPTVLRGARNDYQEPPIDPPFGQFNGVYAPHQYNRLFPLEFSKLDELQLDDVMEDNQHAVDEANEWQTPLLITEFGVGPQVNGYDNYIKLQMDSFDRLHASSVFWVWKEESLGFWGLHEVQEDRSWVERPNMVELLARVYVPKVAGTPVEIVPEDNSFTVTYDSALDLPNQVYVPEHRVIESITCNGAEIAVEATNGYLDVACFGGADQRNTLVINTTLRAKVDASR